MNTLDVQLRFQQLSEARRELRLYALVDGYQHEQHGGARPERLNGINRALFDGTGDEPLAHAGPWLYDLAQCPERLTEFAELEQASPSVSWLITPMDLEGLSQVLQLRLGAELPNGRKALVRFYDPRVLSNLFTVMSGDQCAEFFELIEEWHFLANGQRAWMGRSNAQAQ